MAQDKNQFSLFNQRKDELSGLIRRSAEIIGELSMDSVEKRLKQLSEQVDNDSFKIQIVGTFKNGKSTFINALLGEDILPAKTLPCTAVINEVKYGEKKYAVLFFNNPLPSKLIDCIPDPTMAHMRAHGMENVPPMAIEYDHMDHYVTIPVDGDPEEIALSSPYRTVVLEYPSELLKDGVEIIDSPGLNEHQERTKVTIEYLNKADAIIFLLDATKACAADEMEMIEGTLTEMGFNDMFFIGNFIDRVPAKERDDVRNFIKNKLEAYTPHDIYCVSALQALQAKTGVDADGDELGPEERERLLKKSGFAPLEEAITDFLTNDKGRIKLARPARELNNTITREVLHTAIPAQRAMLDTDLGTLRRRYEEALPRLTELETQKKELHSKMILRIGQTRNEIRRALVNYYASLASKVPAWIESYNPVKTPGFASKRKVKECTEEIAAHVTAKLKENYTEWSKNIMQPLIAEKAQYIFDSSERDLTELLDNIESVNAGLAGTSPNISDVKAWERVAGAGVALFLGTSAGTDMMTQGFNASNFGKNLAIDIGAGIGIGLLVAFNPILGLAAVAGMVWRGISSGQKGNLQKVKDGVRDEVLKSIADSQTTKAEEVADEVARKLTDIADQTLQVIDGQIADVKSQVDSIMADVEAGRSAIERKRALLDKCDHELQEVSGALSNLVFQLAGLAE